MFKNLFALIAIAVIFVSCNSEKAQDTPETQETAMEEVMIPTIPLKDFDKEAGKHVDKEVKVQGIVDHLCKHGGKRLFLVADDCDLHIEGEERFDEELAGMELLVTGIVREFRIDESYCLQQEEDNIKSHSEGKTEEEHFEHKKEQIASYRDSMATGKVDHISYYSLDYVSHEEK
jgi:hypothetical protein